MVGLGEETGRGRRDAARSRVRRHPDRDDRPVPASFTREPADGALLLPVGIRRVQAHRRRARHRPRRIRPAGPQLLPRARADRGARSGALSTLGRPTATARTFTTEDGDTEKNDGVSYSASIRRIATWVRIGEPHRKGERRRSCSRTKSPAAPGASGCARIARRSRARRNWRTATTCTGGVRCRALGIRMRGCWSSVSRPRHTAPIAPDASSPAMGPATSSCARCMPPDSPISRPRAAQMTGSN